MIATYLKGHISRKNESFTLIWLTLNMETGFPLHLREAIPKNRHTFCLDKYLPCYVMINMFVVVNCYDWLVNQGFYSKFSQFTQDSDKMLWIQHSNSDSKFYSRNTGSDTKRLEMLIVLYICLFLILYDSGDTSLGLLLYKLISNNQFREMYCDFFGYIWF